MFVVWRDVLSGRGLCDELITCPSSVVRRCVGFRDLKNEEAMARLGPQRHREGGIKKPEDNTENVIVLINLNYSIVSCKSVMTCICASRVVQARDHLSSIIVCVYSVNVVRPDWRNTKCRTPSG